MKTKPALWLLVVAVMFFVASPIRADTIWFGLTSAPNAESNTDTLTIARATGIGSNFSEGFSNSSGFTESGPNWNTIGSTQTSEFASNFESKLDSKADLGDFVLAGNWRGGDDSLGRHNNGDSEDGHHVRNERDEDGDRDHNHNGDDNNDGENCRKVPVSEPGTLILLLVGGTLAGVLALRRAS